jgi:2-methylcitrate dehydratase PrpD
MQTIVRTLGAYASGLRYDDLPAAVVEKAKVCILDLLGIAAAGFARENAQTALRAVLRLAAPGRASVWMTPHTMRAIDAVLPNSVASHCILQDDWLPVSHSHIGAAVVPVALAVAEEEACSGRDVITAVVAAYDVADRAGHLSVPAFDRGFRPSAICAYFGASTAAAKLMGLTREETVNAIACSGSVSGGVLQPWRDGSMEWSVQEAFGARAGITAATLAAEGLVGSPNLFEGSHGINRAYSGTNENERGALDKLGIHFHIGDTCFKRFPTGGANQGSAAVAYRLRHRHDLNYRRIARVEVDIPRNGTHERMNYAGIPYAGPYHTIDQCFISKPFALAVILKTGDMTIARIASERSDPELLELAAKISLGEADDLNGWNLRMRIALDDGSLIEGDGGDIDPAQLRLSYSAASEKFLQITRDALDQDVARELIDCIAALEELSTVEPLSHLMSRRRA